VVSLFEPRYILLPDYNTTEWRQTTCLYVI